MATAAYPGGTGTVVTKSNIDKFVPEIWSDEIIAAYKKKLVMANLVKRISMKGKKGDRIHIPTPTRGSAAAKAAATLVTIQADAEGEKLVDLDQHWEYSRLIEDIADVQGLTSFRRFYTEDAGYALARQKDSALIQLGRSSNGGAGTAVYANAFIGGDGTTAYNSASTGNASALTDAAIRRTIQRLDDVDADMGDRYLVIPPSSRNTLMGLARFTEQAFTGESGSGNTIRNGLIGDVYGVEVFVTSNCDTASVASGTAPRIALMFHKDAFCIAEQLGVRTQTQYKQEYLATLLTADTLYGVQILRDSTTTTAATAATAFALAVPA
jgi:N4-gp56 family major capsid protein